MSPLNKKHANDDYCRLASNAKNLREQLRKEASGDRLSRALPDVKYAYESSFGNGRWGF